MNLDQATTDETAATSPIEIGIVSGFRSWGWVLLCTMLGILGGLFAGFTKPNEYESTAKIYVQAGERESVPVDKVPEEAGDSKVRGSISNEIHLMRTDGVFRRVAEKVGPTEITRPYDPASRDGPRTSFLLHKLHQFQSWWFGAYEVLHQCPEGKPCPGCIRSAVHTLRNHLTIHTDRSNVLDLSYITHAPQLAQKILDTYVQVHDEQHMEIFCLTEPPVHSQRPIQCPRSLIHYP